MVLVVKSKASKAPADSYTAAACDGCKAMCPESRIPGRGGPKVREQAEQVALAGGWVNRLTKDPNPRRRRVTFFVDLLCPKCAAEAPES